MTPPAYKSANRRKGNRFRRGISLLEITVTLVIVGLICYAVVLLLNNTTNRMQILSEDASRLSALQHCLDLIVSDLTMTSREAKLNIETDNLPDGRETSRLSLNTYLAADNQQNLLSSIEWISSPRYEEQDLVLYRRSQKRSQVISQAKYVPMCEHLCSFQAQLLDPQQQQTLLDPNAQGEFQPIAGGDSLLLITAKVFRCDSHDPERAFTVVRSVCLNRFEL